jgi:hypothetical protein
MRSLIVFVGTSLFAAAFGSGCLDHQLEDGELASGQEYIALDRDFSAFRSWEKLELGVSEHAGATGAKNVYISQRPAPGQTVFPVGTMIVKTIEVAQPLSWQAHAMVKRGGEFNPQGAFGWEFFDLKVDGSGAPPTIMWRGETAPSGHGYETLPGVEVGTQADCNSCHASVNNDAVLTPGLAL